MRTILRLGIKSYLTLVHTASSLFPVPSLSFPLACSLPPVSLMLPPSHSLSLSCRLFLPPASLMLSPSHSLSLSCCLSLLPPTPCYLSLSVTHSLSHALSLFSLPLMLPLSLTPSFSPTSQSLWHMTVQSATSWAGFSLVAKQIITIPLCSHYRYRWKGRTWTRAQPVPLADTYIAAPSAVTSKSCRCSSRLLSSVTMKVICDLLFPETPIINCRSVGWLE